MIKGRDVLLLMDGKAVAAAKSCTIEVSQQFIKSCSPLSGRWETMVPEKASWSASCDCLVMSMSDYDGYLDKLVNGDEVELHFFDTDMGVFRKGNAYVSKLSVTGTMKGLAQLAISFAGNGALEQEVRTIPYTVTGMADNVEQYEERGFVYDHSGVLPYRIINPYTGETLSDIVPAATTTLSHRVLVIQGGDYDNGIELVDNWSEDFYIDFSLSDDYRWLWGNKRVKIKVEFDVQLLNVDDETIYISNLTVKV